MPSPRVLILRAPGTNCDVETEHAFRTAGGTPERVHVNRWLESPNLADDYQVLCIPGGFSYGDDIAAGRILASQMKHHLGEALMRFREQGKLILGICNGFQVLIKSGLLAEPDERGPLATLGWNDSGKFEDRWVQLKVAGSKCAFLRGIETMYLPIAHAEGKFVARDGDALGELDTNGSLVLRYSNATENPNGSQLNTAGLCDTTGRVFGLMPHPERYLTRTNHPRWTREDLPEEGDGLRVFQNAVAFFE